jgi:DNA sulfur modification protein DndE
MIETIRLSEKARMQLIVLKRRTGITQWNVLCRWAFCLSLAEGSRPPDEEIPADSSVEMSWRTFAGVHEDVYRAVLFHRASCDGVAIVGGALQHYFRLHLHRGVSYLISRDLDSIAGLIGLALAKRRRPQARVAT